MIRARPPSHGRRRTLTTAALLFAALLGFSSAGLAADYAVIANKAVSAGSLSKADTQAIFLGDKTKWDDGQAITFAIMDGGEAHKAFLQDIVSKTPSQFDNYWKRLVFTGKASSPKTFSDAQKLMEFVTANPGAIGYVPAEQADKSVKTISIK